MWNKHSCFETSMHAPLIIATPGVAGVKPGTRVAALTEFIDIYPSLCELTDSPIPDHLQGRSLLPLMKDPKASWKEYAIGRFGNGDTVRSEFHRYSEYSRSNGVVTGSMLYDHRLDPEENKNVVGQQDQQPVVRQLSQQLHRVIDSTGPAADKNQRKRPPAAKQGN
jgi:iduronate 2-sulfatase